MGTPYYMSTTEMLFLYLREIDQLDWAATWTNIPVGNNSMLFSLKIDRDPSKIVGGRLCVQSSPYRFSSYKIYRTTLDPSLHSNVQDVNNGDWVLAAPLTLSSNYTGW